MCSSTNNSCFPLVTSPISEELCRDLISRALDVRGRAYVPYSGFAVGAALLTDSGEIFTGCNVESCSYTPTNCAERSAYYAAISAGHRGFSAIAIVGGHIGSEAELPLCPPCGVCRQVMREFSAPEAFYIIVAESLENYQIYRLSELLPLSFGPEHVDKMDLNQPSGL
ncbi:MAG: cytidine deaminase [Eubacteriales bacterium]|nr:cytidine deaminase [Eubacteriales bacterium]